MKGVLITGANGFIAQHIAKKLKEADFFVIGTSRTPGIVPNYDKVIYGVLGKPLTDVFKMHKICSVIHCAFDQEDINNVQNAEGTRIWAEQAEKSNVGLQIFMSSISANRNSFTPYSQKKYEVENWFIEHDQVVFRLGLVFGNGGLFGRIISSVKNRFIIPLIDMGKTVIYPSDIDTISNIVRDTVLNLDKFAKGRILYLQQGKSVLFIDVLKEIRRQLNLRRLFVPVPYIFALVFLRLIEKLPFLKLGINANNLKGLRQAQKEIFKSDLQLLGYPDTQMETLINKSLK